jgi:CheY-like chemotaxis protein
MDATHRRVLVVEDDEAIRVLVTGMLAEAGYAVRAATDGREGLELLRGWRPDAIVLDVALPGMDGWAFREAQRRLPGAVDIPVVVVSGGHRLVAPSPELIPAAIVPKPFDVGELLATVARLVARRPPGGRRDAALV